MVQWKNDPAGGKCTSSSSGHGLRFCKFCCRCARNTLRYSFPRCKKFDEVYFSPTAATALGFAWRGVSGGRRRAAVFSFKDDEWRIVINRLSGYNAAGYKNKILWTRNPAEWIGQTKSRPIFILQVLQMCESDGLSLGLDVQFINIVTAYLLTVS